MSQQTEVKVNVAVIKIGQTDILLAPVGDQIIVLEDKFKTGYECSTCGGDGYIEGECDFCKGSGKENVGTPEECLCRICCPRNLFDSGGYQPGHKICQNCQGKGSLIVAPETSQQKPSTGVVLACGPDVYPDTRVINQVTGQQWSYPLQVGDHIVYSRFAGTGIELKQKTFIRVMHAHELMCKIYGSAKLGDFTR